MIGEIHGATGHPIRLICNTLEVPRSIYYHAATPTPTQLTDQVIGERIEAIFLTHRRRYGYRRIHSGLSDEGLTRAPARVRRLMQERGLKAIQPRTCVPQTSDGRADLPSPNLLLDQPLPTQLNQVWAGGFTYIPTSTGWLYLAVVIDLCSRRIVGCHRSLQNAPPVITSKCTTSDGGFVVDGGAVGKEGMRRRRLILSSGAERLRRMRWRWGGR